MRLLKLALALCLLACLGLVSPGMAGAFTGDLGDDTGAAFACPETESDEGGLSLRDKTQVCTESHAADKKPPPVSTDIQPDRLNDLFSTLADEPLYDGKSLYQLIDYSNDISAKKAVEGQLALFTDRFRGRFSLWLTRSKDYFPALRRIFTDEGLPEDLVYLSLIESGFNFNALSRSHAAGPWQFMEGTARKYGLKVNYWVDERRNPFKATVAASRYLKDLYERFGAWELALAAYNAGEGNVDKAISGAKTNNFWEITRTRYLTRETKDFVPRFIAANRIGVEPLKYGFEEQSGDPAADLSAMFDTVIVTPPASIAFIAEAASTSQQRILELNPELKRWCLPPGVRQYTLHIPVGTRDDFLAAYAAAPDEKRMRLESYVVKKEDTISSIARRHSVASEVLAELNNMSRTKILTEGALVVLPPMAYRTESFVSAKKTASVKRAAHAVSKRAAHVAHKRHNVKKIALKKKRSRVVAD
jgi:membrane-bound lytic murein transglycosylase D